jgi:ceramide glucosyltransferase
MGLLSSPSQGIRAGNFWGHVEVAFLNTYAARWQLALDSFGLGLAQGKTLFMPREVIENGGGIEALANEMAEDAAATKMVLAQGLRSRHTRRSFPQPIGRRKARDVWGRMLRWSRLRRDGYPLSFAIEALQGFFLPFGAAVFLSAAGVVPAIVPLALPFVWFAAEVTLIRIAHWPCSPRGIVALVVRDALLPAIWIATWFGRRVVWHGTTIAPNRPD